MTRSARSRSFVSPIIIAAHLGDGEVLGAGRAGEGALRSTVTSSANGVTSRNLWLIIRTVRSPRLGHVAQQAEHLVGLAGVSTEVGSSRIRKRWSR